MIAGRVLLGWVLSAVAAVPVGAQGQFPRPRSIEVSAAAIGTGGADFGKRAATLTANDPGAPDYVLFSADTSIGAGAGLEGRLSFDVTRTLALEGAVSWVRQTAATRVTGDVEGGPDLTASQRLDTYQFEGAALGTRAEARLRRRKGCALRAGRGRGTCVRPTTTGSSPEPGACSMPARE